jgi:hypothetical protein
MTQLMSLVHWLDSSGTSAEVGIDDRYKDHFLATASARNDIFSERVHFGRMKSSQPCLQDPVSTAPSRQNQAVSAPDVTVTISPVQAKPRSFRYADTVWKMKTTIARDFGLLVSGVRIHPPSGTESKNS